MGGGYLGHEMGGGALGTIGGLVAGAWGARELERRHERYDLPFLSPSFPSLRLTLVCTSTDKKTDIREIAQRRAVSARGRAMGRRAGLRG